MNEEEFQDLLKQGESASLDWKKDYPPELLKGKKGGGWDTGRAKLLKALVSIANGDEGDFGFLIYGVEDLGNRREVVGITKSWDDADFQTWAEITFDPPPTFSYSERPWDNKKTVGIFKISRSPYFPHVVSQTLGNTIFEGQVWFRRGSKNTVALRQELDRLFSKPEPTKIRRIQNNLWRKVEAHYSSQGLDLALILKSDKDDYLDKGFQIAYFPPNTKKEVWVGEHQGRFENIAMIKPMGRKD